MMKELLFYQQSGLNGEHPAQVKPPALTFVSAASAPACSSTYAIMNLFLSYCFLYLTMRTYNMRETICNYKSIRDVNIGSPFAHCSLSVNCFNWNSLLSNDPVSCFWHQLTLCCVQIVPYWL
ncbi:hypothetical protein LguiA_018700 [Lonicera macranthoides]